MDFKTLFNKIYFSSTEEEVDQIISSHTDIFKQENWHPYGDSEDYFGVIENQQASPIPALVEKITNSIDAILMRKCYEAGIDPKSDKAPKSMNEAIHNFFPDNKTWDLTSFRKKQSENIQIIADGPRMETSIIIYDDGEGQTPENFEHTFLSLLRGNKNEILFVQGKYNMGGSGAIVFCGKKRYQLIASKKYNGAGDFGFTLIRKHPFTEHEKETKKNTWYEYFRPQGKIASFPITELNLGLYNKKFKSGSVIKLYSYDLPAGSRSVISRDLNQSINEYLFEPALPIYTIDKKERYPDDRNLERDLFGLKRRLEEDNSKYVEDFFIEEYSDKVLGKLKVICYVFYSKIEGKDSKESKESIRREFFKNGMYTMFSMNGQVHGHFTSEFTSRTLKMQLIKDYVLIHVDCTNLNYDFRSELFMASRDRLKQGEETTILRNKVADILLKSKLVDIYKRRKDTISFAGEDKSELLKQFTKNLPLKSDLLKLLSNTFKLEEPEKKKDISDKKEKKEKKQEVEFKPKRFPSYFKFGKDGEVIPTINIPIGTEKSIKFNTDVENEYFVRVEEPGELQLSILKYGTNESEGGTGKGIPKQVEDLFYIQKSNPENGTIKIVMSPTIDMKVGENQQVKATLTSPGENFDQIFIVKITDPNKHKEKAKKKEEEEETKIGLPDLILVYKEKIEGEERKTWEDLDIGGITMDYDTIMHPQSEGDILQSIYINMDSNVLKDFKKNMKNEEQMSTAEKRYYTSVYFHTLFLYTISKNKKYSMKQMIGENEEDKDLVDYIKDVFQSYYAQFLLNFGMSELVESLE